jgi:DNA-binding IclR family transcriptional regulator
MSTHIKNQFNAPALEKGLDILEYLSVEASPQSQADIAKGIGRGPNEIYRMLVALEGRGYLNRDTLSGKYRLSLKLYQLSHTHTPYEQICLAAKDPMEELAEATRQSCHLGVLYNARLLVIAQTRSPGPVSLSIAEGTLFRLTTTVSGRVLLAHTRPDGLDGLLRKDPNYRQLKPAQREELQTQLERIRKQGHDLAPSEYTEGVTDCAVLIGDSRSDLIAALAVSSVTTSLNRSLSKKKLLATVCDAAEKINVRIGV